MTTLADLRALARKYSGREDQDEISDSQMNDYINEYLTKYFPLDVKLYDHFKAYFINLYQGQGTYDIDQDIVLLDNPQFANGLSVAFFTDPGSFYLQYQNQYISQQIGTGDGTTLTFASTINQLPIIQQSFYVTDGVEMLTDKDATGILTGNLGGYGTINYQTGAVSATFNTAPTGETEIRAYYDWFNVGLPRAVLFYQNQIQIRPIPNQNYLLRTNTYWRPATLTADSSEIQNPEWARMIAMGAALIILKENMEMEAVQVLYSLWQEEFSLVQERSNSQLITGRIAPSW